MRTEGKWRAELVPNSTTVVIVSDQGYIGRFDAAKWTGHPTKNVDNAQFVIELVNNLNQVEG